MLGQIARFFRSAFIWVMFSEKFCTLLFVLRHFCDDSWCLGWFKNEQIRLWILFQSCSLSSMSKITFVVFESLEFMVTFLYRTILSDQTDKWAVCAVFKLSCRSVYMKPPHTKYHAFECNRFMILSVLWVRMWKEEVFLMYR